MDHRNRQRSIGLSRIPGTQSRTTSAPLALHVEQESRGQDSEQRESPRQRTATYAPLESEELADNVMGKDKLFPSQQKGGGFIFFFLCPQETGVRKQKTKLIMGRTGVRDQLGKDRFPIYLKGLLQQQRYNM